MAHHGFINDMLDVKVLILYIVSRLLYPVEEQALYELCLQDDKVRYFDVMQALPQMVESGHLEKTEAGYVVTDKGREDAAITKGALAFPVAQRADRAVERFNRESRRDSFVRTEILEQPNGEALAVLHLNDQLGSLITVEYTCPTLRQAELLAKVFPARAERLYRAVTEILTAKEIPEEDGD